MEKHSKLLLPTTCSSKFWADVFIGIFRSVQKDLKLVAKRGMDIKAIRKVIDILENEGQVPAEYHPYILKGNWNGIWECHIAPDWLLLYDISDSIKLIRLVRTGTHSDLFKK